MTKPLQFPWLIKLHNQISVCLTALVRPTTRVNFRHLEIMLSTCTVIGIASSIVCLVFGLILGVVIKIWKNKWREEQEQA
jgi:hypothetical protein